MKRIVLTFILFAFIFSCSENNNDPVGDNLNAPRLIIKLRFDPNQIRLDNLGQPAIIPTGNATQSPSISRMSANYIEFAPSPYTLLGTGEIIFEGPQTNAGGEMAIDFQNSTFGGNGDVFYELPLSEISSGTYQWVRVSLAYQEGDIDFLLEGNNYTGTLASFVGYNTYITNLDVNGTSFDINENKLQGFWAFEVMGFTSQGQAPEGATTVPNPLFDTSPIPQGSCVVTGEFENGLTITGDETQDVEVILSFSINNSFEWTEVNADGKFEPSAGEQVVDMGLRGLIPIVTN